MTTRTVRSVLTLLTVVVVGGDTGGAQERRPLAIDDIFAIKHVGDPRVSPEGNWVAYTRVTDGCRI
jgi:hypothetical protein